MCIHPIISHKTLGEHLKYSSESFIDSIVAKLHQELNNYFKVSNKEIAKKNLEALDLIFDLENIQILDDSTQKEDYNKKLQTYLENER